MIMILFFNRTQINENNTAISKDNNAYIVLLSEPHYSKILYSL